MTPARDDEGVNGSRRGLTAGLLDPLDLEVPARPDSVAIARHAVTEHLATAGVPTTVIDDIELLTSELVTNAIIHPRPAADSVHVRIGLADGIEVQVAHRGEVANIPPPSQWRPAPATALSGRGLGIVRRLCDDVTVEQIGDRAVITCWRSVPDSSVPHRGVKR